VARAAEAGVDVFRVFDSLNWMNGMQVAMEAVRKSGKLCEGAMCYTGDITDPRRDKYPLSYYVSLAKELERMGAHVLGVKDMAGLLKPLAARKLVKALKEEVGIPVHLHTHDTSGYAGATLLEASQAGVDIVDAALSSLSGLTSQPSLNTLVAVLKHTERDTGLDEEKLQLLANYWETVREWYAPFESGLKSGTAEVYRHEIPGGQYSNFKPQVAGLGLIDRWEECKEMYRKVNLLFGDIVKVTPSSKVVGDMAMFLVKNDLQPEDVFTKGQDLAFPDSVVGMMKGMLGQPHGGFPAELQEVVLKGQEPIHVRPGELLEPADLEAERAKGEAKVGHPLSDEGLASWMLYPGVYAELEKHRAEFSDTSFLPTPEFFYGMEPGQEMSIEIEQGKTLIVRHVTVGPLLKEGKREVFFELNGLGRTLFVRDDKAAKGNVVCVKADTDNPKHVGAPMVGRIVKVCVKAGDTVAAGSPLLVTEVMKMETTVKAKHPGKVLEVRFAEGGKVEKEDLLVVLE